MRNPPALAVTPAGVGFGLFIRGYPWVVTVMEEE
jgi:hypothetical protein